MAAKSSWIHHLTGMTWLACGTGAAKLEITCGRLPPQRSTLQGCLRIYLKPGCQLRAGDWEVTAPWTLPQLRAIVPTPVVRLNSSWMSHLASGTHLSLGKWPEPGTKLHDTGDLHPVPPPSVDSWTIAIAAASAVAGVLLAVLLVAVARTWMCRAGWCGRQGSQSQDAQRTGGSWNGTDLDQRTSTTLSGKLSEVQQQALARALQEGQGRLEMDPARRHQWTLPSSSPLENRTRLALAPPGWPAGTLPLWQISSGPRRRRSASLERIGGPGARTSTEDRTTSVAEVDVSIG